MVIGIDRDCGRLVGIGQALRLEKNMILRRAPTREFENHSAMFYDLWKEVGEKNNFRRRTISTVIAGEVNNRLNDDRLKQSRFRDRFDGAYFGL